MNAVSRLGLRTKIIVGFMAVLTFGVLASVLGERLVGEPRIELTFSHYETNQNVRFAVLDIRNIGNAPAIFSGYATNSPDSNVEFRTASGEWSSRILRCIVPGDQVLPPGGAIRARQFLQENANWRAGFSYTKARLVDRLPPRIRSMLPYMRRKYTRVWTPEMPGEVPRCE